VADWGGGMSAICKPRVQLFADVVCGWPHSALRYHSPDAPLPPASVDDDADGISEHRLAPCVAHCHK